MSRRKKVYKRLSPYLIRFGERGLSIDAFIQIIISLFNFMVWVFIVCTRGSLTWKILTKYALYNVIQAILLNILCSCSGVIFTFLPIGIREIMVGLVIASFLFLSIVLLIVYSSLLIGYGQYPKISVLSEAGKLHVQVWR